MAAKHAGMLLQQIRMMAVVEAYRKSSDNELLEHFVTANAEGAFAALLRRHGPMVLRVCQRVLGHAQDAEDAFQATFLVLARKAASIRKREAIGAWLHGVAYRLARKARTGAAQESVTESANAGTTPSDQLAQAAWRELRSVLDEELSALSETHRAPLVQCYLEGQTQDEAAQCLGWSLSTLKRRLRRARDLMRARLARRGLSLGAVLFVGELPLQAAPSCIPISTVYATVKAAATVASSGAASSAVSAKVAALTEGMVKAMSLNKLKIAIVLLLTVAVVGTTARVLTHDAAAQAIANQASKTKKESPKGEAERKNAQTDAKKLLEDSFQATAKMTYPTDRIHLLLWIARARARLRDEPGAAGAIDEALRITGSLADDRQGQIWKSQSLTTIAITQAEVGDFAGARQTIEQLSDPERYVVLRRLAEEQARTGDIKGALHTASTIGRAHQKGYALKGIAAYQAQGGDIQGALATTRTIKDDLQRIEALVSVAHVQYRKGESAAAKERLQQAREIANNTKPGPTGQEPALALLEVADALVETGDKQGAVKITKQVLDSKSLPEPTNPPQSTGYWRIARIQWKTGDLEEAHRTAELIKDPGMRSRTLMEIAVAQIKSGDFAGGLKTSEMLSDAGQGFDWQRFFVLKELGKTLAQKGDKEAARRVFQQALQLMELARDLPHPRLTSLGYLKWLAGDQALVGQEHEALTWIEKQNSPEFRAAVLVGLAEAVLDRNKKERK